MCIWNFEDTIIFPPCLISKSSTLGGGSSALVKPLCYIRSIYVHIFSFVISDVPLCILCRILTLSIACLPQLCIQVIHRSLGIIMHTLRSSLDSIIYTHWNCQHKSIACSFIIYMCAGCPGSLVLLQRFVCNIVNTAKSSFRESLYSIFCSN